MPYKDPERKRAWEQQHRTQRLARRRELRRFQEAAETAQDRVSNPVDSPVGHLWLPLVASVGLAAYSPKFALGVGGLTRFVAASYQKDWSWWLVGLLTIGLAVLFLWSDRKEKGKSANAGEKYN
jgi:hypothetical protein